MKTRQLRPLDVDIIRCLQQDARMSFAGIAARLRVPESTVRDRVKRLNREQVVQFAALTNPLRLGYQIWALIDIQTEPGRTRSIGQQIAKVPEVYWVGITTGPHDLHVGAVFRSNKELLDFVAGSLPKIRGLVRTSTVSILELIKHRWDVGAPVDIVADSSPGQRRRRARQRARGA